MNVISIFLVIWGAVSLLVPVYMSLIYPFMKLKTPAALGMIEDQFINLALMSDKDLKSYQFAKDWIISNDKGLIKSARVRLYVMFVIGFISAGISFIGAFYFYT